MVSPKPRTTCVYLSFSQVSSPVCLVKMCPSILDQYNNTPLFSPAKLHYPLAESDPFPNKFRYLVGIYRPRQNVFAALHSYCITSTHSILGQKWCTLYLSLFDQPNQRFHLQISGRRNLNRGICNTPIFDLRHH